ncbi:MAG: hypothetical protein PWQ12_741 [Clostridiales bacterium]|nr:hypothetical protein [Clostridiales bacterium]
MDTVLKPHDDKYHIYTLGRFDVIKEDVSLVASASGSKKIWELYKFMLTYRDRAFTPESLMDQLWVSESYNDPRSTLRRQMHRLRQALLEDSCADCDKTLLFSNGYYKWNHSIPVSLDNEQFEAFVDEGEHLRDISPNEALKAYRAALDLYVGDYLPECFDQHWVFPIRNHYRRLYLTAVEHTVELLLTIKNYDEIVQLCQKAIQIDTYEEHFHLRLMEALMHKGQQKQALEHYEYITGFYYQEMGLKPSNEMKALYKKLLQTHNPIQSEQRLSELLDSEAPIENAYYCEPDVFRSIYELEVRHSQRSGTSFSVGVVGLEPSKRFSASQEALRVNHLKQHLMEHLRMGDTFTLWGEMQFLILLQGVDRPLMEKVLTRVIGSYSQKDAVSIGQIEQLDAYKK